MYVNLQELEICQRQYSKPNIHGTTHRPHGAKNVIQAGSAQPSMAQAVMANSIRSVQSTNPGRTISLTSSSSLSVSSRTHDDDQASTLSTSTSTSSPLSTTPPTTQLSVAFPEADPQLLAEAATHAWFPELVRIHGVGQHNTHI